MENESFKLAKKYLGKKVRVVIDRPIGAKHPKHGFRYKANYGYLPGATAPDGEELDVYYLGVEKPLKEAEGRCVAIIHRLDDDDDKLVVVPPEKENMSNEEIKKAVHFQEKWFKSKVIRDKAAKI